jgi:hypothetical protein
VRGPLARAVPTAISLFTTRSDAGAFDSNMPRINGVAPGGMIFHVLNGGVDRQRVFQRPDDYSAFESVMEESLEKRPIPICSDCLMPNYLTMQSCDIVVFRAFFGEAWSSWPRFGNDRPPLFFAP